MAVTEEEVAGLWGADEAPESAPAPAAEQASGITESEVADLWKEDDDANAARMGAVYEHSLRTEPERTAAIKELSRKTGVPEDVTSIRFDEMRRSFEAATFDYSAWQKESPELDALAKERPDLAGLVLREKKLSPALKALKTFREGDALVERADALRAGFGLPSDGGFFDIGAALGSPQIPADQLPGKGLDEVASGDALKPKPTLMRDDPAAQGGVLDKAGAAYRSAAKGAEHSKLGFDILQRMARGEDTAELEAKAAAMQAELAPPYLGEQGALSLSLSDGAEILPSIVESYKSAGIAGAAGALVGGAAGALTKKPAAIKKGAQLGFSLGARGGSAVSSFRLESGGALLENLQAKTDDGRPVERNVVLGGAIAYGLAASAIESATFGVEMSAWGPLGDAIRNGTGKAFIKSMMASTSGKALLKDVAKRWGKGAGAEALEEMSQEVAGELASWATKSVSAGEAQKFDVNGLVDRAVETGWKTMSGVGALAPAQAVVSGGTQLFTAKLAQEHSERSSEQVATLASVADSPLAKADPEAAAKLVEQATAKAGAPVNSVHVDPAALMRLFQSEVEEGAPSAQDLLGPDAERLLQESMATGAKVEVPVSVYLEKWGPSGVAAKLLEDTATEPGTLTARELKTQEGELEARAQELVTEYQSQDVQTAEDSEAEWLAAMEAQLISTGTKPADARAKVMLWRAQRHTAGERFGIEPAALFANTDVSVAPGDNAPSAPAGAMAQGPAEEAGWGDMLTERVMGREGESKLSPEARATDLFVDSVSGLRNRAAWDASPRQPGKMVAVITTPDVKPINDHEKGGHDSANAFLRRIGTVVGGVDPEAARSGTDFLLHVSSREELQSALDKVRAVLPDKNLKVVGGFGADVKQAFDSLKTATDEGRAKNKLAPRGKTLADLSDLPGLEARIATEPVKPNLSPELVERAAALPDPEFFRAAYLDKNIPGVLNKTGFDNTPPKAHTLAIDGKGLKAINDDPALGPEVGDQMLAGISRVAERLGGSRFFFAHLSGDEYAAKADSLEELQQFAKDLEAELKDVGIRVTLRDGRTLPLSVGIRLGIGERTYGAADRALNAAKRREGAGGPAGDVARGVPGAQQDGPRVPGSEAPLGDVQGPSDVEARAARAQGRGARPQVFGDRRRVGQERVEQGGTDTVPRGFAEFAQDGLRRLYKIALNKNADLSTFLHESAHVFLEMFGDLAAREDAPQQVKDDYATALKFMGADSREGVKREQHEKFARGFEAYLFEGKAPSAQLEGAFARFKLWLQKIYRSISALRVELNPDIRGVFDRLLATDEEIARTKRAMGLAPIFRSPEEAGMSPEQWQAYLDSSLKAHNTAARQVEHRVLKDKLRQTEAWWKEEEKQQTEQAATEYQSLPAVKALTFLRTGDFVLLEGGKPEKGPAPKLDPEAVRYMLGREARGPLTSVTKKGGLNPDDISDLFGYPTGRAMLEDIERTPERDAWLAQRSSELMAEKYPEVLDDRAKMRELAAKGLHGDATASWLLKEWAALRRKAGAGGAPVESIKRAAQVIAERREVKRLDAGGSLRTERSAAENAAKAAAKGNYPQAAVFKQQQLLNMYLHLALTEAREERDAFETLAGKLADDKSRARMGKASPVYRDGVDMVLESFGLKEPDENRETQLPSLGEVTAAMEADGATVMFDTQAVGKLLAQPKPWKELTVAEMRTVHEALKNIRAAARAKGTVLIDGKRVEKEQVVSELVSEAKTNLPSLGKFSSSESAKGPLAKLGGLASAFDGSLLKPELMAEWLGGGSLDSKWFKGVVKPLQDAKAKEADLLKSTIKPIIDAFEKMPKDVRARFREKVDGEALFPTHRKDIEPPTRRFELLMMALNAGNESNLKRLLEGRDITGPQLRNALDLLTKEELDWVQSVWDASESLWPESAALEERDSGLRPEKLAHRPLETRHGTYRGGYFPAIYDRRVEPVGETQQANTIASLMDPSFTRPGTSRGHLKGRAQNFSGVLSLEPNSIPSNLSQVAHDIAFREPLKSVGGLILNPEVQAALKERLGDGRAKQFLQWLKDIGSMRGMEGATHSGPLLKFVRGLRSNTITSVLGYSIPTALGDLSNLLAAVPGSELKTKHWAAGLAQFTAAPLKSIEQAESMSGELRSRRDSLQRDLSQQVKKLTAKGPLARGPLAFLKEHAFTFLEMTDRMTATPIWMGAYRQASADGKSEKDAITFADATIRKLFPSQSPVDTATVLRDKGYVGASLMFYGFFSQAYNRNRAALHELHTAEDFGDKAKALPRVGGRLLAYAFATSAVSELLSGRGREDDEEWTEWFLRKTLSGGASTIPFGGDLAQSIEAKVTGKRSNPRASPLVQVADALGAAAMAITDEDASTKKRFQDMLRSVGLLLGLPVTQVNRTGGYLGDLLSGDTEARNPADAASGIIYGERENQPVNPANALGDAISGER